jgi:pimeloyl-ACP methyl ester carboxylesterase
MTPAERMETIGGVRTRVLETDGAGPPVLLLHGLGDSADTWRPLFAELDGSGRAVTAVDLPGFGRAETPRYDSVLGMLDDFVTHAIARVDAGDRVTVVGNSLGGLLALRSARTPRTRASRVVAICPGGYGAHPAFKLLEHRGRALAPLTRVPGVEPVVLHAVSALASRAGGLATQARRDVVGHLRGGGLARLLALSQDLLRDVPATAPIDPRELHAPVTFVWGDRDTVCPLASFRRAVPADDLDLVVLEGEAHAPQHPRAGDIARIVLTADRPTLTVTGGPIR